MRGITFFFQNFRSRQKAFLHLFLVMAKQNKCLLIRRKMVLVAVVILTMIWILMRLLEDLKNLRSVFKIIF
uniref:Uncharacterized protein n=1 Tax=Meloidogyne enterolobii TaxID=390850 RepID=A0A6V7VXD5_MELEN|nr:unnamed protein product [Meloidogyne enterolobii]